MSKLLIFMQVKGKWHKFSYFNLGVGAKLYKNFAQKLLAVSLCMAVVLLGTPVTTFAEGEPDKFITAAKANHWGRSDLRAYLNNGLGTVANDGTVTNKNFGINSTTGTYASDNSSGYASQFSDAEYALVKPFKYHTNVFVGNSQEGTVTSYATTDRFWLPSGNYSSNQVLSWGATDVSRDPDYADNFDSAHAIPISYWPAAARHRSWLRSPYISFAYMALRASRGDYVVYDCVYISNAAAAAFKLDLSSVIFASAASAASLAAEGGSAQIEILGTSHDGDNDGEGDFAAFGESSTKDRPSYGMYLKSAHNAASFAPTALSLSADGQTLTVSYTGGDAGQYVVVQAFKEDNLAGGTTSYAAAEKLVEGRTSVSLGVSNWGLASLDGYTIKVWMEEPLREDGVDQSSLAKATTPVTFVGSGDSISKTETDAVTNQRVFAMKKDLQTSWGDLQALKASNETAYNNVIAGKGQDGSAGDSTNSIHGLNPTNQKIYFGKYAVKDDDGNFVTDSSGDQVYAPLEFWIAGRETYDGDPDVLVGDGEVDPTGEIVTLYQAKSVETKPFNASYSNYDGNKKSVTLQLADEQTAEYTGSAVAYPTDKVTAKVVDSSSGSPVETDIPFNNLRWQHRAQGATAWTDGMPSGAGTYQLRCYAPGVTDSYERTYSSVVTFTINQKSITGATITVDPNTRVYTGTAFEPGVTVNLGGFSNPLVKDTDYTVSYKENTNAGTATITITGNGNFTDSASTTFTITKAAPNPEKLNGKPTLTATYGQTLGDIKAGLASAIGSFLGVDDQELEGVWAWEKVDATKVGNVGENPFTALFKPTDTSNYDWTTLDGWDADKEALAVGVAVDVAQATPDDSGLTSSPSLTATYGQTLGDIKEGLASAVGSFLDLDGNAMKGNWAWEKADATKVGDVGENKFTAIFTPTDGNYAKTTIDVTVKISVDTSKWGDAQKRDADGKTQYVDSAGKTSIELTKNNLSDGGILWLFEESYGKSAWYGIDLSTGAFDLDKGLRLYVRWLNHNDADYAEIYAQLDDAQKARVEGDNGWIFLIGVEGPDGNKVQPAHPVNVYVQIGDDWDVEDLNAYYITSGGDENVPVEDVTNFTYPGGTDEFGMMTLSHFSPYFIFDELTDEEKALPPSTGDISTELLISVLAIVIVSSLGVMLRLITNKKKFEE